MNDLSFIRLMPNFNDAKYTRASTVADIYFLGQIVLSPNSFYVQETNTKDGIAFNDNYAVYIVDCNDTVLKDITNNIAIEEFIKDGIPQIRFEVVNIGTDYFAKTVFFKFVHTVSNYKWWSNPLNITDYFNKEVTRFDYADATDEVIKSIGLKCYFSVNDAESVSGEYTTYEGNKVTSRLINTELEKYIFQKVDNFTYRRLNYLLSRNVIYINGYRITNKQTLPSKDASGNSNTFNLDFKVPINYNESFTPSLQLFPDLLLTTFTPFGTYTLSSLPTLITGNFNKPIVLGSGNVYIYKNGFEFQAFGISDITVSGNQFTIDITGLITDNDSYSIRIDSGLFNDNLGQTFEITNDTDWAFELVDGQYSNTDYSTDYILN